MFDNICQFTVYTFGQFIKQRRETKGLLLKQVSLAADIDQALLCKLEKGARKPSRSVVSKLAKALETDELNLLALSLSDRILELLDGEQWGFKAMEIVNKKLKLKNSKK